MQRDKENKFKANAEARLQAKAKAKAKEVKAKETVAKESVAGCERSRARAWVPWRFIFFSFLWSAMASG